MYKFRFKNSGLIILLLLGLFVPLFYSLYTGHIWEDYYITYKFSRNLAKGNGLVYYPGEKAVHGFTSPFGVLLPALAYFISHSDSMALWIFRIFIGIPCFIAAIYMLYKTSEKLFNKYPFLKFLCPVFLIFEVKSVMFSVNGMETALMLFFVSWLIKIFIYREWNWMKIGLCFGALMWTRPDSCVYIGGIIISFLLFLPERTNSLNGSVLSEIKFNFIDIHPHNTKIMTLKVNWNSLFLFIFFLLFLFVTFYILGRKSHSKDNLIQKDNLVRQFYHER